MLIIRIFQINTASITTIFPLLQRKGKTGHQNMFFYTKAMEKMTQAHGVIQIH